MKIKQVAPIYYRYFRIQRRSGISLNSAVMVSVVSFTFSMLNALLTSMIVNNSNQAVLFIVALFYYTCLLFSVKVMAFSRLIGKILLVLFSAIGFVTGINIF